MKAEFQVGKAKTEASEGRIVPLNQTALIIFQEWKSRWPNAKPDDFIFPTEKLSYKGQKATTAGTMTAYDIDPCKPLGGWKKAWSTAKN